MTKLNKELHKVEGKGFYTTRGLHNSIKQDGKRTFMNHIRQENEHIFAFDLLLQVAVESVDNVIYEQKQENITTGYGDYVRGMSTREIYNMLGDEILEDYLNGLADYEFIFESDAVELLEDYGVSNLLKSLSVYAGEFIEAGLDISKPSLISELLIYDYGSDYASVIIYEAIEVYNLKD